MTQKTLSHGNSADVQTTSAVHDDVAFSLMKVKRIHSQPLVTPLSTSSLPIDIMLVILSHAIEMPSLSRDRAGWFERRFSLGLSHVCGFWRAIMMENKVMWTNISVLWDRQTIDWYHTRAGDLPVQYHLVMEGPSSARRADNWLLDTPVQEFIRTCTVPSASSAKKLNIDLQVGGWPGFGRAVIADNLGRALERMDAPYLEELSINGIETPRFRITGAAFKGSDGLPALHKASLTNLTVANESAFFHSGLTHLSLYKVQVEWGTLNLLERLPNLISLSISPLAVTLITISTRYHLPHLQTLALRGPARDVNTFMGALFYPHTCSVDVCLMETLGADLDKNTVYARGVFETLRTRLEPHGTVDVFNHLDVNTDPFIVRLALSQRTCEHRPVPNAQSLVVTLVAFLPNRRFLLKPLVDDQLPGMEFIRTLTSTYAALGSMSGFPHHRDLWTTVASRTPRLGSYVLRGHMDNATSCFDALEAAHTDTRSPLPPGRPEKIVLEGVDCDAESEHLPAILDPGSSFWAVMERRPALKVIFKGCAVPSGAEEGLSRLGNVSVVSE
ncbi:unnamed protein product [Peniophora sp. CBMAI 1063]|nr:unnamed protein product [Peniophora sp. CBMAI 1063]